MVKRMSYEVPCHDKIIWFADIETEQFNIGSLKIFNSWNQKVVDMFYTFKSALCCVVFGGS